MPGCDTKRNMTILQPPGGKPMTETLLLDVYRSGVDVVARAVSSWQGERDNARLANEWRDALLVCRGWPEDMRQLERLIWKKIMANQVDDFQQTGEQVLDLFDRRLGTLAQLRDQAAELERRGCGIEGAAELDKLREELSHMRQDFDGRWLWINEAIIEEARA